MAELKRSLGLWQCIFFGVGSILGAGIYTLLGKVAGWGGNMTWLAFLFASIAALFTAFSYAELSAAFPSAGGEYSYASKAFGKKTGTVFGVIISMNGIISGATVSLGFAGYFSTLLEVNELIAAFGIIGLIFLINVSGIKESSLVNTIFTLIEAVGLFFVIYVAMKNIGDVNYLESPEQGVHGFFIAAALGFYAFIGFEDIVKLAEETKDPEKNIPRALFISTVIVMILYSTVALCVISVVPWQELKTSDSPLADVIQKNVGATGVIIISVIALFSTSNTILSNMLGSSRVMLGMANKTRWMKKFAYVSKKRKTPVAALIFILIVMIAFASIGNIETVALIANLFIFVTFIMINLSVIVLRKRQKHLHRPYKIPFNISGIPVISFVGILITLFLLSYNVYNLITRG